MLSQVQVAHRRRGEENNLEEAYPFMDENLETHPGKQSWSEDYVKNSSLLLLVNSTGGMHVDCKVIGICAHGTIHAPER